MIIKNLRVEEGFFNNLDLEFSNGLNVLVGGRGVGKTSVIELLRFGLGADNLIGEGNKSSANHALSILQSSGRVSIDLELPSGEEINVTRSAQDNIPLTGSTYIAPIIFSQKEIETIGVTKIGRLSLIDSFIPELKDTNFKINELNVILRSLSAHYYAVKQEFNDISDKTTGLENLKNRELELQKKNDYLQENNHKIKKNQNEISIIQKSLANYSVQLQNIAITRKFFEKRKYDLESIASVNNNYIALDSEDNQELMLLLKDRLDYDNKLFKYLLDNNDASLVEIDNFISEINHKKVNLEIEARKTRTQVDNFTEGAGATLSELGRVREQLAQISNYSKIAKQKDEQLNNIYQQMQDKLLEIYNLRDDIY
ncbi:ATP-binding protein, partial [Photobacterium phosphoreum]